MTSSEDICPKAGIPFSLYIGAFLYLAIFEFIRWHSELEGTGACIVIAAYALGGAWENWRLLLGAMLGKEGLDSTKTAISSLMFLAIQPLLWIPLSDMLGGVIGLPFLGVSYFF